MGSERGKSKEDCWVSGLSDRILLWRSGIQEGSDFGGEEEG